MNLRAIINRRNIFLISLIIIGVIAILVSIYILNLKPYVIELEKRDRDHARIEDLSLIDSALTKLKDADPSVYLGDQNRVYVSVPSYSTNCSGLELPSLPEGFKYRCETEADYLKIDGNGWLPVDFTKLPKDFKFKESLPKDPTNTADSGYYYAYTIDKKNDFVITSLFESDEYLKKTALSDGGTDPARLEVGSNLQLWAKVSGLVGYWSFDENEGDIAKDLSGNRNDGTLINGPIWTEGKFGKALSFDGVDDYVNLPIKIEAGQNNISTSAWVYVSSLPTEQKGIMNGSGYAHHLWLNTDGAISYGAWTSITNYQTNTTNKIIAGQWNHIVNVNDFTNGLSTAYINGANVGSLILQGSSRVVTFFEIGRHPANNADYINGKIDGVRLYNKALNTKDIQYLYNSK